MPNVASLLSIGVVFSCTLAAAEEIPSLAGWRTSLAAPGTHRTCVDLSGPHSGKGSGKIAAKAKDVTADGMFSWEEVECLGACVNAPMVQVWSDTYEDLTPESLPKLLDAFARGEKPKPGPQVDRRSSAPEGGPLTLTEVKR